MELETTTAPVRRDRRLIGGGVAALASGALVLLALVVPGSTVVDALALVGLLLTVVPLVTLVTLQACGSGFGRTALTTWLVGYAAVVLSFVASALSTAATGRSIPALGVLVAVPGALLVLVGGPVAGVAAVRARVLRGWRRSMPPVLAVSQVFAILPGLGIIAAPVLVLLYPLVLTATGIALLTQRDD